MPDTTRGRQLRKISPAKLARSRELATLAGNDTSASSLGTFHLPAGRFEEPESSCCSRDVLTSVRVEDGSCTVACTDRSRLYVSTSSCKAPSPQRVT